MKQGHLSIAINDDRLLGHLRLAIVAIAVVMIFLWSPFLHSFGNKKIVLVNNGKADAFLKRVEAELSMLDYTVEIVETEFSGQTHLELMRRAREIDAPVAASIVRTGDVCEVWVADSINDRVVVREVPLNSASEGTEAMGAVGVVELLRATLLEIEADRKEAKRTRENLNRIPGMESGDAGVSDGGLIIPTPEVTDEEPEEMASEVEMDNENGLEIKRVFLEAAPGLTSVSADSGPMMNFLIGIQVRTGRYSGIGIFGLAPLVPSKRDDPEGNTSVHAGAVGGTLRLHFVDQDNTWQPSLGAGFAAIFFNIRGQAGPDYLENDEVVAVGAPILRGGLAFRVSGALKIRTDILGAWALSKTVVLVAGKKKAAYGRPLISGMIGIELALW